MGRFVDNRWFPLVDLLLVVISGAAWMLIPQFGIALSLIALLPWVLRYLAGRNPFQRTVFDWLIAIFIVTAWVGYWAAYDKTAAWIKVWLIVSAVLLYYALSSQPRQNFGYLSFLSFCFALALGIYFCLTYDFADRGRTFAMWWISHRPIVSWPEVHHGYISGLLLISTLFAVSGLWTVSKKSLGSLAVLMQLFIVLGTMMVALVFFLTFSRGIDVIGVGAIGLWIFWRVSILARLNARVKAAFPVLVLSALLLLIIIAYFGPASTVLGLTPSNYGTNSRAELFSQGVYLLAEYPFMGAGLASFPGLYSQYMLVIPYFYFANSYNLFLDVAIEQGLIAGSIFLILYLGAVWLVSRQIVDDPSNKWGLRSWLGLFALIVTVVHGLFYDYLYNGSGTILLFYPLGMAMTGVTNRSPSTAESVGVPWILSRSNRVNIGLLLAAIALLSLNISKIVPLWHANLGAVQMSQAELKDFPTDKWATSEIVPRLELADATLHSVLPYDPHNYVANYRLGLISMLRQDFKNAAAKLEIAYQQAPNHRGIIKNLGYCYVWLGDMDKAGTLLHRIPEAQDEMDAYVWWWATQGRPDLSEKARIVRAQLMPSSQ